MNKFLFSLSFAFLVSVSLNAAQGRGFVAIPTNHPVDFSQKVFFVTNGALGNSGNQASQDESKINQAVEELVGALVSAYCNPTAHPKPLALLVNENTGEILSAWPNIKDGNSFANFAEHRAVVDAIKTSQSSAVASTGYSTISRKLETITYQDAIARISQRAQELGLKTL